MSGKQFSTQSEEILGRIRAHLSAWRASGASAELLAALRGEFRALKIEATAAGIDEVSRLGGNVDRLLARSGEWDGGDDVGLLNLLEETHDGLAAKLGLAPTTSADHVKSLNRMVALLLPDSEAAKPDFAEETAAGGEQSGAPETSQSSPPGNTLGDYLPRLRRFAEEVARQHGKPIRLSLRGGDIEIDRRVLERMMAPLETILRNSIEHGIEPAAQRKTRGKAATGHIRIAAARQGGEWLLEYADDGGGLAREKLAAEAVEMGMTEYAESVGEAHLLQIITQPGYGVGADAGKPSVAESGCGAGLDAVYRAVCELGGLLAVKAKSGQGIRFQFRLPLTSAAARALLVTVARYRLAIPAQVIEKVVRPHGDEVLEVDGRRYLDGDARRIPIIDLAARIGNEARQPVAQSALVSIRLADRLVAFAVDAVHDLVDVSQRDSGAQPVSVPGVAGIAALADSDLIVVLDPVALVNRAALQREGLIRFPIIPHTVGGERNAPQNSRADAGGTALVLVLETQLGPLAIPVGMVAEVISADGASGANGAGARQSREGARWICGDIRWCGFTLPLIDSAAALGAEQGENPHRGHAAVLWPMKGGAPHDFFALSSQSLPRLQEIVPRPAPLRPAAAPSLANLLGYVRIGHRIAMIPDLANLARGTFTPS